MKLSLSVRVAEAPKSKKDTIRSFDEVAEIASKIGYKAVCMRASQAGIQTALQQIISARKKTRELGLAVSMVTGDFPIPINNDHEAASFIENSFNSWIVTVRFPGRPTLHSLTHIWNLDDLFDIIKTIKTLDIKIKCFSLLALFGNFLPSFISSILK